MRGKQFFSFIVRLVKIVRYNVQLSYGRKQLSHLTDIRIRRVG